MAIKDEAGNCLDSAGNRIPPPYVADIDKKRDRLEQEITKPINGKASEI